jgi:hypothetical protein
MDVGDEANKKPRLVRGFLHIGQRVNDRKVTEKGTDLFLVL